MGARVVWGLVREDNMLLHLGLKGYWGEGSDSSVRIQPVVGAEFFLYGFENLGFLVEWGELWTLENSETSSTPPLLPSAGLHYYF